MTVASDPACPRCHGHAVTTGMILGDRGRARGFQPDGLRLLTLAHRIAPFPFEAPFMPNGWGCLDCGLVWSEVNPQQLREAIARSGTEDTVRRFSAFLPPPDSKD